MSHNSHLQALSYWRETHFERHKEECGAVKLHLQGDVLGLFRYEKIEPHSALFVNAETVEHRSHLGAGCIAGRSGPNDGVGAGAGA